MSTGARSSANRVKVGEAEPSSHEETNRIETEPEHESHARGRVPGRDGAAGSVVRTRCTDRSCLAGGRYRTSTLSA